MSFEAKIPEYIAKLEQEITILTGKRNQIDWGHECDCEHCTEDTDPQEDAKELDADLSNQIKEVEHQIRSLKAHATVHGIKTNQALKQRGE